MFDVDQALIYESSFSITESSLKVNQNLAEKKCARGHVCSVF